MDAEWPELQRMQQQWEAGRDNLQQEIGDLRQQLRRAAAAAASPDLAGMLRSMGDPARRRQNAARHVLAVLLCLMDPPAVGTDQPVPAAHASATTTSQPCVWSSGCAAGPVSHSSARGCSHALTGHARSPGAGSTL